MEMLVWIALGLIAGLFISRVSRHTDSARVLDLTLGVAGAIGGALAVSSLGFPHGAARAVAASLGAAAGSFALLAADRVIFHRP